MFASRVVWSAVEVCRFSRRDWKNSSWSNVAVFVLSSSVLRVERTRSTQPPGGRGRVFPVTARSMVSTISPFRRAPLAQSEVLGRTAMQLDNLHLLSAPKTFIPLCQRMLSLKHGEAISRREERRKSGGVGGVPVRDDHMHNNIEIEQKLEDGTKKSFAWWDEEVRDTAGVLLAGAETRTERDEAGGAAYDPGDGGAEDRPDGEAVEDYSEKALWDRVVRSLDRWSSQPDFFHDDVRTQVKVLTDPPWYLIAPRHPSVSQALLRCFLRVPLDDCTQSELVKLIHVAAGARLFDTAGARLLVDGVDFGRAGILRAIIARIDMRKLSSCGRVELLGRLGRCPVPLNLVPLAIFRGGILERCRFSLREEARIMQICGALDVYPRRFLEEGRRWMFREGVRFLRLRRDVTRGDVKAEEVELSPPSDGGVLEDLKESETAKNGGAIGEMEGRMGRGAADGNASAMIMSTRIRRRGHDGGSVQRASQGRRPRQARTLGGHVSSSRAAASPSLLTTSTSRKGGKRNAKASPTKFSSTLSDADRLSARELLGLLSAFGRLRFRPPSHTMKAILDEIFERKLALAAPAQVLYELFRLDIWDERLFEQVLLRPRNELNIRRPKQVANLLLALCYFSVECDDLTGFLFREVQRNVLSLPTALKSEDGMPAQGIIPPGGGKRNNKYAAVSMLKTVELALRTKFWGQKLSPLVKGWLKTVRFASKLPESAHTWSRFQMDLQEHLEPLVTTLEKEVEVGPYVLDFVVQSGNYWEKHLVIEAQGPTHYYRGGLHLSGGTNSQLRDLLDKKIEDDELLVQPRPTERDVVVREEAQHCDALMRSSAEERRNYMTAKSKLRCIQSETFPMERPHESYRNQGGRAEEGRWRGGVGEGGGRRGGGVRGGEGYSHESWSLSMGRVSLCYSTVGAEIGPSV